jgi:hypothetical protein
MHMDTPEPRRLLLSEDHRQLVWLDLETGGELVVPRDGGEAAPDIPIARMIEAYFESVGVPPRRTASGGFAIGFRRELFDGTLVIEVNEEKRVAWWSVDLGLVVPGHRREAVAKALVELQALGEQRVVLTGDRIFSVQYVPLGNLVPSVRFVDEQADMAMNHVPLFHLLLGCVIAGLCKPESVVSLARTALESLTPPTFTTDDDHPQDPVP